MWSLSHDWSCWAQGRRGGGVVGKGSGSGQEGVGWGLPRQRQQRRHVHDSIRVPVSTAQPKGHLFSNALALPEANAKTASCIRSADIILVQLTCGRWRQ